MRNSVQYFFPHGLLSGTALLGHHQWDERVQLRKVLVQCRSTAEAEAGAVTRLNLELGGVPTSVNVDVATAGPGEQLIERVQQLNLVVNAGTELRWRCVSDPGVDASRLFDWAVTLLAGYAGDAVPYESLFRVYWVDGAGNGSGQLERTLLYLYDPVLMTFAEARPGVTAGRAVIGSGLGAGATFDVTFAGAGSAALEGVDEGLVAAGQYVEGLTGNGEGPRVEFWIGDEASETRVGSVHVDGRVMAAELVEVNGFGALASGTDRYCFHYDGALRGVLGLSGVGLRSGKLVELV